MAIPLFKSSRVLVRIILSHLLSGVLLTALLLWAVSAIVTARIEASTDRSERELLRQTYLTTDFILTDFYGDFYTLWTRHSGILQALSPTGAPAASDREIEQTLSVAVLNDEAVHSVQLINLDTGTVYTDQASPTTLDRTPDQGAIELLRDFDRNFDEYKDDVFFPRSIESQDAVSVSPVELLSIIYASKSGDGSIHAGLIVNIDRQRLARLVSSGQSSGLLLMISPTGRLIANLSESRAPVDFSDDTAIRTILENPSSEGSLTETFLGEKTFLIYRKATALGFTFIRALPYRFLKTEAQATNRVVAGLFIAAMLISLITSAFSTWMIYHPLNRLIRRMRTLMHTKELEARDEYAYLQTAANLLYDQNRQSSLIRLIYGQIDPAALSELRLDRSCFLTFAIMPDPAAMPSQPLIQQLFEQAESQQRWHAVISAPDCVSVVLNEDSFDDSEMEQILTGIADFRAQTSTLLGTPISIGLGSIADDAAGVRASHRNAMAAVQQSIAMGPGQLVSYAEIENARPSASQNRTAITVMIDAYIQEHLSEADLVPEQIASHVGLSVGYMRQIFRLERGMPINDYVTTCRITRAQDLLSTTDWPAKKIAEAVGYADSRYFYTLFKKRTGETTEEYRQRTRQTGT